MRAFWPSRFARLRPFRPTRAFIVIPATLRLRRGRCLCRSSCSLRFSQLTAQLEHDRYQALPGRTAKAQLLHNPISYATQVPSPPLPPAALWTLLPFLSSRRKFNISSIICMCTSSFFLEKVSSRSWQRSNVRRNERGLQRVLIDVLTNAESQVPPHARSVFCRERHWLRPIAIFENHTFG